MSNEGGLTDKEKEIMDNLLAAWKKFQEVHSSNGELQESSNGLHQCQDILGRRVLSRDYPEYWL